MLGDRKIIEGRYCNANYYACAIVAVVTEGIDWAAYMNGCNAKITREDALEQVAEDGDKLSEKDARHFFPDIESPYRD
jgi:hypothetical protein